MAQNGFLHHIYIAVFNAKEVNEDSSTMAVFTLDFLLSGCPLSPPAELAPALRLGFLQAASASLSLIPVFSVYVVVFNFLGGKGRLQEEGGGTLQVE